MEHIIDVALVAGLSICIIGFIFWLESGGDDK